MTKEIPLTSEHCSGKSLINQELHEVWHTGLTGQLVKPEIRHESRTCSESLVSTCEPMKRKLGSDVSLLLCHHSVDWKQRNTVCLGKYLSEFRCLFNTSRSWTSSAHSLHRARWSALSIQKLYNNPLLSELENMPRYSRPPPRHEQEEPRLHLLHPPIRFQSRDSWAGSETWEWKWTKNSRVKGKKEPWREHLGGARTGFPYHTAASSSSFISSSAGCRIVLCPWDDSFRRYLHSGCSRITAAPDRRLHFLHRGLGCPARLWSVEKYRVCRRSWKVWALSIFGAPNRPSGGWMKRSWKKKNLTVAAFQINNIKWSETSQFRVFIQSADYRQVKLSSDKSSRAAGKKVKSKSVSMNDIYFLILRMNTDQNKVHILNSKLPSCTE